MRVGFAICTCIMLGALAGCSQPPRPSNKLVLWHWMTDRQSALQKLAQQYKQETGIDVDIQLFAPSEAYSQKIIAAAQADVLPDIYGILDKKSIVADFIKAGLVTDLTPAMEADGGRWKNSLFSKALADKSFWPGNIYGVPPGIYGVPIDVTNEQMLYNKKLLAKAGIKSPPQTFDEFIRDARMLRRVGITPFVSGWGELWLLDCFASNYAFNIMGPEKIFATFRGQVKYTDPDWIRVFQVFAQLRKNGVPMDGIVTKGNKYAEQDFALGRAAFAFDGSWCVNVYHEMNPNLDYGVIPPPPVSTEYPLMIWGSAGSTFVVNGQSPNKDKAIAFLKWLTAKKQQVVLARRTNNLPSNREALISTSPVLSEFAQGMDRSTHPNIWPLNEDPTVSEAFDRGLQAILIGEKTPEQVAAQVEQVKEQQMAKKREQER
ncbi:MAG: extracellular solute-binding protein [Candidatus Omnitrophica bacterium]|nr:extracellular solute-binding protein [Candidatus Omnitrophota bacterium]MDE2232060.1 extracellular solute-binding protein [Candidatus Omnitrophota bacterium]